MASPNMSIKSSIFSSSPETFLYNGPSVPVGYQSLFGTFSGVDPSSENFTKSTSLYESTIEPLTMEHVYMFSGNIPQASSQGGYIALGG